MDSGLWSIQPMWVGLTWAEINGKSARPTATTAPTAGSTSRHLDRSATISQAASIATAKTAK